MSETLPGIAPVQTSDVDGPLRPLRDLLIVEEPQTVTTQSGIILRVNSTEMEESQKQWGRIGTVVAVGNGEYPTDKRPSKRTKPAVKPGQRVMFGEFKYPRQHHNQRWYTIISEKDVVGIVLDSQ